MYVMDLLNLIYFFLILFFFYLIYFFKESGRNTLSTEESDDTYLGQFLLTYGGSHLSHMIYLGDKRLFWAQEKKVLIAYKTILNQAIVLGDPIGDSHLFEPAIRQFYIECQTKKIKPVFYQVSPKYMHMYHENGFRFLKLGEEGLVNLQSYSLKGKQGAKLRSKFNKFNQDGYTFSVMEPPYSPYVLSELRSVSNSWLGTQKEKSFSVVSFSEDYVSRFQIAVLRNNENKILAFVTLASDYRQTLIIDLMRKIPITPNGTMEVLFIHILKWANAKNYTICSLGMAPLSNVGNSKNSFLSEKFLRFVHIHGSSTYNTKGLKDFKDKFACEWEPKYLAYQKTFLPTVFVQLFLIINKTPVPKDVFVNRIKLLLKKAG